MYPSDLTDHFIQYVIPTGTHEYFPVLGVYMSPQDITDHLAVYVAAA